MARKRTNPDYLNGVPELLILRLLSRKPMHGYQIVQSMSVLSQGQLEFGEGCIYPLLHRLELDGALTSRRQSVAGVDAKHDGRSGSQGSKTVRGMHERSHGHVGWFSDVQRLTRTRV